MRLKQNDTFLGIFTIQKNNKIKVSKAQKLTHVNQFKTKWADINSREFSRVLNRAEYLIK